MYYHRVNGRISPLGPMQPCAWGSRVGAPALSRVAALAPLLRPRTPARRVAPRAHITREPPGEPRPKNLADLLPFESDDDTDAVEQDILGSDEDTNPPTNSSSSSSSSGGGGGLASTLGLAPEPAAAAPLDPTEPEAQEIIDRATRVLQAARQALKAGDASPGTIRAAAGAAPPSPPAPATAAASPSSSSRPPRPTRPPPRRPPPNSSSKGPGVDPPPRRPPPPTQSLKLPPAPPAPPTAKGGGPNSSSSSSKGGASSPAAPGGSPLPPSAAAANAFIQSRLNLPGSSGGTSHSSSSNAPRPPPPGSKSSSKSSGSAPSPPPPAAPRISSPPAPISTSPPTSSSSSRAEGVGTRGPPPGGPSGEAGAGSSNTRRWSPSSSTDQDLMRHVLQSALDDMQAAGTDIDTPADLKGSDDTSSSSAAATGVPQGGEGAPQQQQQQAGKKERSGRQPPGGWPSSGDGGGGVAGGAPPVWAASLLSGGGGGGGEMQLQRAPAPASAPATAASLDVLDRPAAPAALELTLQSELDVVAARSAVLPPLQSVVELTSAFRPPDRNAPMQMSEGDTATEGAVVTVGRTLADGSGVLPDGTRWEKKSGIEYGKNGYWKRWHVLSGTAEGGVTWSETWWDASDWTGMKELGAEKEGAAADGSQWKEAWTERLYYASNDLDSVVERTAHKWAVDENKDEWEEKWGEYYHASGKVAKWADKWGKAGANVWHERWGEDYTGGESDACVKWTDKWAERLLPGGAREQWGDKWHEQFEGGRGEKNGEVWSVDGGGHRYQRWWGEQHLGEGRVRRHGHSTGGEYWDDTISMDTYYNPVPHFGFKLALSHSPQLKGVPLRPKDVDEKNPFGIGLDDL